MGLPLAVYGSELDAAVAPLSTQPLVDLPLRSRSASARPTRSRRPGRVAMRRPPRQPRPAAIVGMAASLAAALALGAMLVRPRRPVPAAPPSTTRAREDTAASAPAPLPSARGSAPRASVARVTPAPLTARAAAPSPVPVPVAIAAPPTRPRPDIYTVHPDVRADRGDVPADRSDQTTPSDNAALVLRAQLRRAEESRDRLADRVDRLRARMNVPVITDVDRYQRLQDELETAREDLDRAQAEVGRWRRALRRAG